MIILITQSDSDLEFKNTKYQQINRFVILKLSNNYYSVNIIFKNDQRKVIDNEPPMQPTAAPGSAQS